LNCFPWFKTNFIIGKEQTMKTVTPSLELIAPSFGSSFYFSRYDEKANNKAHLWHYHPEIELVFINGGSGKRQIGSHISYYTDGDLILIGSQLPHCGFTDEQTGNKNETVIQMKPDFLGNGFFEMPETKNIRYLFERAGGGIAFGGETKNKIGQKIEKMNGQSQFERLVSMLEILNELEQSQEFSVLNAKGFSVETRVEDNGRVNLVFNYVKDHFQEPIALEAIAELTNMTVPSFCRYFKKVTNKTFTKFVNEYRLVHASKLLAEKPMSIADVCFESGFNNFSHFNKSFREFTGKTASEYRNELRFVLK